MKSTFNFFIKFLMFNIMLIAHSSEINNKSKEEVIEQSLVEVNFTLEEFKEKFNNDFSKHITLISCQCSILDKVIKLLCIKHNLPYKYFQITKCDEENLANLFDHFSKFISKLNYKKTEIISILRYAQMELIEDDLQYEISRRISMYG